MSVSRPHLLECHPARLCDLVAELQRARLLRALQFGVWREGLNPLLDPLDGRRFHESVAGGSLAAVGGKELLDSGGIGIPDVYAQFLRLRPVLGERTVDEDDLRGGLLEPLVDRVEGVRSRRDEQPEHERRQRGNQPGDQPDHVF